MSFQPIPPTEELELEPFIKLLLALRGMTSAHVARRIGLSQSMFCQVLKGHRRLEAEKVITVAEILGCDPMEVLKRLKAA